MRASLSLSRLGVFEDPIGGAERKNPLIYA